MSPEVTSAFEIGANVTTTISILLAGRNSVHTWWIGIAGCVLFAVLFSEAKLYADTTLQVFFVITSAVGWWQWRRRPSGAELPVRRTPRGALAWMLAFAAAASVGYGWLLFRLTDAYAPFVDSVVLSFSVVAQLLLMGRRYETWWCWIVVNTLAVPLYLVRGLHFTALLYGGYWVNAVVATGRWRKLASAAS